MLNGLSAGQQISHRALDSPWQGIVGGLFPMRIYPLLVVSISISERACSRFPSSLLVDFLSQSSQKRSFPTDPALLRKASFYCTISDLGVFC